MRGLAWHPTTGFVRWYFFHLQNAGDPSGTAETEFFLTLKNNDHDCGF
jgi:hypothetical protein